MPTPTWAAWIILTSLAPSPIASKGASVLLLTSLTTKAFWRGDTRPMSLVSHRKTQKLLTQDAQQMTAYSNMISMGSTGHLISSHLAHDCQLQENIRAVFLQRVCQAFAICQIIRNVEQWIRNYVPIIRASSSVSPPSRWFLIANKRLFRSSDVSTAVSVFTMTYQWFVRNYFRHRIDLKWELTRFIDSDMSRQERPMLIAVSCLSPVNTQIWVSQSRSP